MQNAVLTSLDNPRISIPTYTRCLLERLAKAARMDSLLSETRLRATWTGKQVTGLAGAFVAENFSGFGDAELLEILTWYARLGFDTSGMSNELIRHFRGNSPENTAKPSVNVCPTGVSK